MAYFIPRTGLETALNNNPGIIHLLQHSRHHYRAITAGTSLPYKSDDTSACTNQLEYTYDTQGPPVWVIKNDSHKSTGFP